MTNLPAILAVLFLAAMFPCRSEAGWIPFSPGRAYFLSSLSSSSSLAIHQRNKSDPAGKEVNDRDVLRSICFIRGGNVHFDSEGDEEEDDDEDEEEADFQDEEEAEADSEAEDETEEMENSPPPSSSVVSGPPVKLTISTNLLPSSGTSLLDQALEFTASRKRTVLGIKQAISKTMAGRPYSGCSADESEGGLLGKCLVLRHRGRVLEDDESIEGVVAGAGLDEEDEDEDDEEEEDEDEDDDVIRLKFALDILPPVDAKFGIELMEKAKMLSTKDLMEAYCTNMAGMIYGQELMREELENLERVEKRLEGDGERGGDFHGEEDEEEEDKDDAENDRNPNHSLNIRKAAALIKKQMLNSLSPEALRLMEEEHDRVQQFLMNEAGDATTMTREQSANSVFGLIPKDGAERRHRGGGWDGGSRGRALKGGAAMNVKRALQRNMNVNWADTTRNSLLFLFFGYFGGRNSFSRTFLLLSSPLCFVLQTRPVKVALKQLFYTIGEPPGILLSLLPAPQQAIMSLDYGRVMRELYGEKALEGEEWMTMEQKDRMMRVGVGGEEDEYDIDEDLEEYDDEADYDFDQDED